MYPKRIKIIDTTYTIKYVDSLNEVDPTGQECLWGYCDYWNQQITILNDKDNPSKTRQILLHEVLHAMAARLDIEDLTGDENNVVDHVAVGLNAVLSDNPNFLKMFEEKDPCD